MKGFVNESDPQTIQEAKASPFWDKWKETRLLKQGVFGKIQETPIGIRYKARFLAQSFTQRFGIDYTDTYSLVMNAMSFCWLIHFTIQRSLHMRLMMWLQPIFMVIWIKIYT